ncbi:MAG: hypothetical protein HGA44_21210, partial [Cellulomonadaceae bacterium]|nr:hypothetical protein [Cellulomonadaceae bacterium]
LGMNRAIAMVGTGSLLGALVLLGAMPAAPAAAAGDTADYSQWKTLTRERVEANGAVTTVDTRTVTVSVDQTSDLRGRESVLVSWAGARPSAARTFNPYGYDGMNQEYPVVILQCRGLDDPNLPAAEQVQPETCWTSNFLQRFGNISTGDAVWQHDLYAADEDTVAPAAATWPSACGERYADGSSISQHLLPFRAANGTIFQS